MSSKQSGLRETGFFRLIIGFIGIAYPAMAMLSESFSYFNLAVRFLICLTCFGVIYASHKVEKIQQDIERYYFYICLAITAHMSFITYHNGLTVAIAIEDYFTATILSAFFSKKKFLNSYLFVGTLMWVGGVFHVKGAVGATIFIAAILTVSLIASTTTQTRIRLMKQIHDNSLKMAALLKAFPDKYYFILKSGQLLEDNGVEDKTIFDLLPASVHANAKKLIEKALNEKVLTSIEYEEGTKHFEVRFVPQSTKRMVVMVRDITEKKKLERETEQQREQLLMTSRQASIGRMAGGIAHEINNPLNGVVLTARATVMCKKKGREDMLPKSVGDMQKNLKRIQEIIWAMSIFAGDTSDEPVQTFSVNDVFEIVKSQFATPENGVDMRFVNEAASAKMNGDKELVAQAILQMVKNSVDAVKETKRAGFVEIAGRVIDGKVTVFVTDNGIGIPADVQDKIFEPFFTTKEVGAGQGLGLSVAKGIALRYGGDVTLLPAAEMTKFAMNLLPAS